MPCNSKSIAAIQLFPQMRTLGQKTTAGGHSLYPEAEPQSVIQACDYPGAVLVAVTPPETLIPTSFSCRGG